MRQKQRGVTFLGLVVVAGILVFGGIVGMQVFPTYIEFLAVQKAAKKAASGVSVSCSCSARLGRLPFT